MSAYMVDREHIVYLVQAAISLSLSECDGGSIHWAHKDGTSKSIRCTATNNELAVVGNMLWDANKQSMVARYGDGEKSECLIVPEDFKKFPMVIKPVQVLKACACFRYQACEFAGWKDSEAADFIDTLEHKAINALPGYADAVWGAPK